MPNIFAVSEASGPTSSNVVRIGGDGGDEDPREGMPDEERDWPTRKRIGR